MDVPAEAGVLPLSKHTYGCRCVALACPWKPCAALHHLVHDPLHSLRASLACSQYAGRSWCFALHEARSDYRG